MEPGSAAAGRIGLPEADGVRPVRRRPGRRSLRARRAPRASSSAQPLVRWPGPPVPAPTAADGLLDRAAHGPGRARRPVRLPFDPASVRRVVGVLAPVSDGLLVGEHANRPDFPPTMFAAEVLGAGGRRLDDAGLPRPQPRRPRAGAGRAGRGRRRRRPLRDRRRPRGERAAGRHPGVRPRRRPARRAGRGDGPAGRRPRVAGGAAGRPAARPRGREAAGRRAALRAQPREQRRPGGRLRRRRPRRRAPRCRSSPASPSTPTSRRPGCCSASPACTWTAPSSSGCSAAPDPRRAGIAAAVARRGRCWPSPASSA